MIRNFKTLLITLLLVIASAAGAWAQPTSGSGTSGDPYLIGTAADLKAFAEYVNADHWTACAKLTADIDLSTVCSETLGTVAVGATLTFDWKVSSEARYDKFYASIYNYDDDTEVSKLVDAKSGEMSGKVDHSFTTSGHYYLKLWYTKDNSTSGGSDTATATNIKYVNLALVPGEVWADLDVDVDDVNTLRSMVLGESAEDPKADLNGDGRVTIGDVTEAIHQLIMP